MIEFKLASTGTEVYAAQLADMVVYLFKLKGESVFRVTVNAIGVVGVSTGYAELGSAIPTALMTIATVAEARSKILAAVAAECVQETALIKVGT